MNKSFIDRISEDTEYFEAYNGKSAIIYIGKWTKNELVESIDNYNSSITDTGYIGSFKGIDMYLGEFDFGYILK